MPLPGTQYHGTGSAKDSFIQFHRTRALRALVLLGTVWTCPWQNPVPWYWVPGKDTFNLHPIFYNFHEGQYILNRTIFLHMDKEKKKTDLTCWETIHAVTSLAFITMGSTDVFLTSTLAIVSTIFSFGPIHVTLTS